MRLNKYLDISSSVIINLKTRPEKRAYMEKQLQGQNIKYEFFSAEKHKDPKRGCLESHISVIKNAIKNNEKYILIMEDDCKYIKGFGYMEKLPDNWDMIYLGGTVHRILDRKYTGYERVQCWKTHAYIVNLPNPLFVKFII